MFSHCDIAFLVIVLASSQRVQKSRQAESEVDDSEVDSDADIDVNAPSEAAVPDVSSTANAMPFAPLDTEKLNDVLSKQAQLRNKASVIRTL